MPDLTIRGGHPDFLDLPWDQPLAAWQVPNLIDLPRGISRHEVRFVQYPEGIYAVKELPTRSARQDYTVLRALEGFGAPAVRPVGLVEDRCLDGTAEEAAALITAYEPFSFSYRELLAGPGFGPRRNQMLDAFAGLLVQLHLAGTYWGDCSLSNTLYRFDAGAIDTIMVDAETAFVVEGSTLTDGQRDEDLEIMIVNVAGGMADIAAEHGHDIDDADLSLGEDIAERYRGLWAELTRVEKIGPTERYRITERIGRINALGFDVEEVDLEPVDAAGSRLRVKVRVGGRSFHATRLRDLTGVEALENQARQILADLNYFQCSQEPQSPTAKNVSAIRWRVQVLEPMLDRLRRIDGLADPIQAYCDLLHHRYVASHLAGHDIGTEAALEDWLAKGRPGYPLD